MSDKAKTYANQLIHICTVSNNTQYDLLNLISVNPAVPPKWLIECLRDCVHSFDACFASAEAALAAYPGALVSVLYPFWQEIYPPFLCDTISALNPDARKCYG